MTLAVTMNMLISTCTLTLTSLVAMVWLSRHFLIWSQGKKGFLLTETYPGVAEAVPKVSVVVAAKDEAENIETCLTTMLDQDYPNFEMVVCNDRSTDETADIVQRIATEDSRLELINIKELPDQWCGKNNAMQTGIAGTDGEWICMIDADCRQTSRRTLSAAVRYAIDTEADLLSVLPVLEMRGFWENVIQPVCGGVMMIWFYPDKVNDPAKPNAYANGAFMLIKRSAYEAIGTHEAVKSEVNEDMHMASLVKRSGLRLVVARSQGLYVVRMYTSLAGILRGWGRIFYGTFGTLKRLTASFVLLAAMGLVPYAAAAWGLSLTATTIGTSSWHLACGIAGVAGVILQISVIYRYYKLIDARPRFAWTYPIGVFMVMLSLLISLSKLRSGASLTWRGTVYNSAGK